jgi:hypothetical protein
MGKYTKRITTISTVRKFCTPSSQWTTFLLLTFIRALCHYRHTQPAGRVCRQIPKKRRQTVLSNRALSSQYGHGCISAVHVSITWRYLMHLWLRLKNTKCNINGKVFQILRGGTTMIKSGIKAFNTTIKKNLANWRVSSPLQRTYYVWRKVANNNGLEL